MFLHLSVILFTVGGRGACVVRGVRGAGGMRGRGACIVGGRGRRYGHCSGRYRILLECILVV